MIRALFLLAANDLRNFRRDKVGLLLGFALPVALVSMFGFVMGFAYTDGSGGGGQPRVPIAVTDHDESAMSVAFVKSLEDNPALRVRRATDREWTLDELEERVSDGKETHALLLPAGFGAALEQNELPDLVLLRDPGRQLEAQLVTVGLLAALFESAGDRLARAMTHSALMTAGLPEAWSGRISGFVDQYITEIEGLFLEAGVPANNAEGVAEAEQGAKPKFDMGALITLLPIRTVDLRPQGEEESLLPFAMVQSVAGMAVMMLMFGLVTCGASLIREREEGTLRRLLVAPIPRGSILAGKSLAVFLVGLMQLATMFLWGSWLFDVDLAARPGSMLVVSITVAAAVTAFGIVVAAWAQTEKQAEGLATLIILLMSMLGGAWFPIEMMAPDGVLVASRCTLTWWAMEGFKGVLYYGKGWWELGVPLGILWGFTVLAACVAAKLFRTRYRG